MARIRSVHPSLFTDEAWVSCSPLARILYIGLWTDADDQGLFEWKPLQIKMRLLPGDGADATALLAELVSADLITSYEHGGKRFGAIREFRKFQRPQKPNAIHPLPENIGEYVGLSSTSTETVSDHSDTSRVNVPQMEDGGKEEKNPPAPQGAQRRKPEVPIPEGCPSADIVEAMQAEARSVGANIDLSYEARQFRDWWTAKDGRNRDWDARWRTWARKAIKDAPKTAIAALTARTAPPSPADRWDGVVREFRANGYWNRDDHGPPPGREGCRAPPSILALYGYAAAAKHANDPQPQEAAA